MKSKSQQKIEQWFDNRGWKPFHYQQKVWDAFLSGQNGLLNAPTGSGKTYALWMPMLMKWMNEHPHTYKELTNNGLQLLWITPLRALARDIEQALQKVADDLDIPWEVGRRTGDVSSYQKQKLKEQMPEALITTPESLHIMMAQNGYEPYFSNLDTVIIDEWHELLGSKRGTQTELGLSHLKQMRPNLNIWGISATIGNLQEALNVLLGADAQKENATIIKADVEKSYKFAQYFRITLRNFRGPGISESSYYIKFYPSLKQADPPSFLPIRARNPKFGFSVC